MSLFSEVLSWVSGKPTIQLYGEVLDDGYLYLRSKDLKGFSLMLEPDQHKDFGSLVKSVGPVIDAYATVYYAAKRKNDRKPKYHVRDFSMKSKTLYTAKLESELSLSY